MFNLNAILEFLVWDRIESEEPTMVKVFGISNAPDSVRNEVELVRTELIEARAECRARNGYDVPIDMEIG